MDFKRKLSRLSGAGPGSRVAGGEATPKPAAAREDTRARVQRMRGLIDALVTRDRTRTARRPASTARASAEVRLPGELRETPHGPVHLVERWLEPHHAHGRTPIRDALAVDAAHVAKLALDPALESVDFRRMLLFDTETTGLSGGAGTIPFLIGLAWFEDESLHLLQLLLRRPGEEGPMLRLLAERMAAASCLVSYNGKSFDWPLLRTRFVLNRVPMPPSPPHLDLLHCARRIFKRRLSSVRLVDMEVEVLGMRREHDVDGAEIPGLYIDFLRGADGSALAPVIEHNGHDIVALAGLLARLTRRFEHLHLEDDPRDHLSYAHVAARAKDAERAAAFAKAAAEGGGDAACTVEAFLLTARLARARGAADAEEEALSSALAAADEDVVRATVHLCLAKLYEHRCKDPGRALLHAREAVDAELPEANARRVARLERRIARAAGKGEGAARRRKGRPLAVDAHRAPVASEE